MPRERLPMRKIEEVLRLRAAGMSPRLIAESTGAGKSTVYEYLARADAGGISWPLPEGVEWAGAEAKMFPPPTAELAAQRPVPDWRQIHRELGRWAPVASPGRPVASPGRPVAGRSVVFRAPRPLSV